jgi:hypothetical protein
MKEKIIALIVLSFLIICFPFFCLISITLFAYTIFLLISFIKLPDLKNLILLIGNSFITYLSLIFVYKLAKWLREEPYL